MIETLIPIIGALIMEAPGIIAAWQRDPAEGEEQLRRWLETREDVQAASDRWKAARGGPDTA